MAFSDIRFDPRILKQCEALHESGYHVEFHGVKYENNTEKFNFTTRLYFFRSHRLFIQTFQYFLLMFIFLIPQLKNLRLKPTIIVHNLPNFLIFSCLLSKLFGSQIILDMHDDPTVSFANKVSSKALQWLLYFIEYKIALKVPNKIITVNKLLYNRYKKYSGADMLLLHNAPDSVKNRCDNFYSPGSTIKMVFIGHIGTHYGLSNFLKQFERVSKSVPITLDIYGDGVEKQKLVEIVQSTALEEKVVFHGRYSPQNLSSILESYHLGVALYDNTPLTNVILPVKILEYTFNCVPTLTVPLAVTREYFSEDALIFVSNQTLLDTMEKIYDGKIDLQSTHQKALGEIFSISWGIERQKFIKFVSGSRSN